MSGPTATRRTLLIAAILFGAVSAQLVWAAVTGSPSLHVPAAVAYGAAWVLALGAVRLLQLRAGTRSRGDGFAALVTGSLAAIGGWIAVGPGARVCTGARGGHMTIPQAGLECRVPFGIGALVAAGIALYAAWRWLRIRRDGARGDA